MPSPPIAYADLLRRLAANARRLRIAKSLTVKRAAERRELHWRHWQKVEAGDTDATMATIVKVADALNADPHDLLREPPPDPGKPR